MFGNFNTLFYYLDKELIYIDKSEFLFQIQSHPDYPTLLSISDTLSFFGVDNIAISVSDSEIVLLPDRFLALLSDENNELNLHFIEKINAETFIVKNGKNQKLNLFELKTKWKNIVLIIEKKVDEIIIPKDKSNWYYSSVLLFALIGIFLLNTNFQNKFFFLFSILGIVFSILAFQDLFGTKIEVVNNFCNISPSTSCSSVIGSKKWKIFNYISFGDLSIIFFLSQFFSLIVSVLTNNVASFLMLQETLLFYSIPIIILSLYFQKYVEKKWCPICIIIILITISELVYLFSYIEDFSIAKDSIQLFLFTTLFIYLVWHVYKKLLLQNKDLKEFQFKANRFIRNYEIFKSSLISKGKIEFPNTNIILGNRDSKLVINIITNPFCGHCNKAHQILDSILAKHFNDIQVQIIIKANISNENVQAQYLYRTLIHIYNTQGQEEFKKALNHWFENMRIDEWLELFNANKIIDDKIDDIYNYNFDWASKNNLNYTPALFVNGYEYPKSYDRENIVFFINELIADADFK